MDAVLAAASYSRGGFSPCLDGSARYVMVPGGITFHLEPGTIGAAWLSSDTVFVMNTSKPIALFCLNHRREHIIDVAASRYWWKRRIFTSRILMDSMSAEKNWKGSN